MIYIYLAIIMVVVMATTFYVRTIKQKTDDKLNAMFQLIRSLAVKVEQIESALKGQGMQNNNDEEEVVKLNINSSFVDTSQNDEGSEEESEEESDNESNSGSDDDTESEHEEISKIVLQENIDVIKMEPEEINLEEINIKTIPLEPLENQYKEMTVRELKEIVSQRGGKVSGQKKSELIEFLIS